VTWKVEWDDRARRELRTLGQPAQQKILRYLGNRIATDEDPRRLGRPLRGHLSGLWRYRVADYRLICRIQEDEILVLVLRVSHRREAYR
jgi:mRNA interferase RelE/StbE